VDGTCTVHDVALLLIWSDPTKLTCELRGILLAKRLARSGRKLLGRNDGYPGRVPTGTAR
jgi:hypothetical protein